MGKEASVVATGGLAGLIGTGSKYIKHVDDLLTLEGLRIIWERNTVVKPGRETASAPAASATKPSLAGKPRPR
jgi:hypothetical protein